MISKRDIEDFFDLEAEAAQKKWDATMKLSVDERIRKRRAIKSVYLDKEYSDTSGDNYKLIRVTIGVNLADFKEGECLILHKEDSISGIPCRLYEFEDDNSLILEIFPPDMPSDFDSYEDIPLVLDKDKVDLRNNVYSHFLCDLPASYNDFWNKLILNSKSLPTFKDNSECEAMLQQTIDSFDLRLLPKQKEAVLNSMRAKDYYLIQGPPGTGKSFVLGIIMLEEIFDLKHNVIVIGPNHLAINNAMNQILKLLPTYSALFTKVGQSYNAPTASVVFEDKEYKIENVGYLNISWAKKLNNEHNLNWLIGLTPHSLYTRRAKGLECDTLIIDEAGQMTIPLSLMGMIKAKKVIFSGDHKQLSPIVTSDNIKVELKKSAFQTLIIDGNHTMLDTSFRMCEPICDFVSDLFYDGELKAMKKGHDKGLLCENPLYSFDAPVVLHEVEDDGEQASDKEAESIANIVCNFLNKGVKSTEIGILSPFRAQAANIRRHIRKHKGINEEDKINITSETIDKMQGQERDVIIYSLVSGNLKYMTEMAEFLYNPNKINVAFSRAKSKLIIVGSLSKISNLDLPDYPHIKKMMESEFAKRVPQNANLK